MSELSKLLRQKSPAAIPATPATERLKSSKSSDCSRGSSSNTHFATNDNATRIAALRREKAESERQKRRDELLMLLADHPAVKYAYCVTDANTDPVVIAIAIRELATFEMNVPPHRYDAFKLLQLIADANEQGAGQ